MTEFALLVLCIFSFIGLNALLVSVRGQQRIREQTERNGPVRR